MKITIFKKVFGCLQILLLASMMSNMIGQETYSRFYDFDVGNNNAPQGLFLEEDHFIMSSTHSGQSSIVSSLVKLDYSGDIVRLDSLDDFVLGRISSITKNASGYNIYGERWSFDTVIARGITSKFYNDDFEFLSEKYLYYEPYRTTNTYGVYEGELEKVVFGTSILKTGGNDTYGHLIFLNKQTDSVNQEIIIRGIDGDPYAEYTITSFQETPDGNYVYLATTKRNFVTLPRFYEIVKINRAGEVLESISGRESSLHHGLLQDSIGGFYFFNRDTPYLIDSVANFPDSGGGLVKINAALDSVVWTIAFNEPIDPANPVTVYRLYDTKGLLALQDGNFLAYGRATGTANDISEWGGFVSKFTGEGEILWTRVYRPAMDEEYIAINNGDEYKESILIDCQELADGRILCAGRNDFRTPEISFHSEAWLLMMDAEGCVFPDCEEAIVLTNTSNPTLPIQEGRVYPNPVSSQLHIENVLFDTYKIYDLMGRLVQEGGFAKEINLSDQMSSGMYVLQLREKGRMISVFKFLKEE